MTGVLYYQSPVSKSRRVKGMTHSSKGTFPTKNNKEIPTLSLLLNYDDAKITYNGQVVT